jgi:hypothetical protein
MATASPEQVGAVGISEEERQAALMECLEVFTGRCSVLRDDAVEAARSVLAQRLQGDAEAGEAGTDWRAHLDDGQVRDLCNQWSRWREWLTDEGLDAAAACALCGDS